MNTSKYIFVRTENMGNYVTGKDAWTQLGVGMGWEETLGPVPTDGQPRPLKPEHAVGWSTASVGFKHHMLSRQHIKIFSSNDPKL